MEGDTVNNEYVLGEQVGKGGFSKVFKAYYLPRNSQDNDQARDNSASQNQKCDFVIKIADSPEYTFSEEARIATEVQRNTGVKCYKSGKIDSEDGKYDFLVLDFMKNGDLFHYLSKNELSESQIRLIFNNLLGCLERLHDSGCSHMDLKLGNILMNEHNIPLLSDFGMSVKANKGQMLDGKQYCFSGSRKYLAPEILERQDFCPFTSDIFSLGV